MKTGDGEHFRHTRTATAANPNPNSGTGTMAAGTYYFEVGGMNDGISAVQIRWTDATSAATVTLETTNLSVSEAAFDVAAGSLWSTEPVVITGPVGAAAGTFMIHLGNNGAKRNRLKWVVTATTSMEIIPHGIH
jgi:hypothetical protein